MKMNKKKIHQLLNPFMLKLIVAFRELYSLVYKLYFKHCSIFIVSWYFLLIPDKPEGFISKRTLRISQSNQ